MKTKTLAQVLQHLKVRLKDEESWMEKYNKLEEFPEDGDEKVTEGIIEALEYSIKQIEEVSIDDEKKKSVASLTNYFNYAKTNKETP